jgi:hypothetical protein
MDGRGIHSFGKISVNIQLHVIENQSAIEASFVPSFMRSVGIPRIRICCRRFVPLTTYSHEHISLRVQQWETVVDSRVNSQQLFVVVYEN